MAAAPAAPAAPAERPKTSPKSVKFLFGGLAGIQNMRTIDGKP